MEGNGVFGPRNPLFQKMGIRGLSGVGGIAILDCTLPLNCNALSAPERDRAHQGRPAWASASNREDKRHKTILFWVAREFDEQAVDIFLPLPPCGLRE